MAHKAPGKHYRKGITLVELFKMFPDNASAEKWFVETRWPDGIRCAYCDSQNVKDNASHKTMPYRCNTCKKRFSVKTNSLLPVVTNGFCTILTSGLQPTSTTEIRSTTTTNHQVR